MRIGFHTDAFNSAYWDFDKCVQWAHGQGVGRIECGLIDGVSWIHGLGYQPHVALYEDPLLLRRRMEALGLRFSQVDAAFPLSGADGPSRGLPYVLKSLPWAKLAGCPCIATTDGLHKPADLTEAESMAQMRRMYREIVAVAEAYEIHVNIEVHGYFTTNPDRLEEMLGFCDSPFFGLNLDTGNSFIAGQDPVHFCRRFLGRIRHVHVKDVSESLAAVARGGQTGIAVSQCAIGEGVNADNIRRCLEILRDGGFTGTLSMECEGQGGPLIEKSLAWLRGTLKELNIPEETGL
ncbi:MAG TPA: sugar phosphate isomerase/epimerase family protein [Candidatus Hydrogenedentes bacterium]|nr:sugar phosphate isomerase/epimerase family protein [Candidatus Hydrogenedentota bacterium]